MVDPRMFLHAQIRLGSKECEVVDMNGTVLFGARGTSDLDAIKRLRICVENMRVERLTNAGAVPR